MITITEQIPNKLPGLSSFRVEFPYNADVVSAVKECGNAVWDAKNKIWEVGMPYLGRLLDKVCDLDDIQLNLLPDSYATKPEDIVLDKHKTTPFSYQEEGIKFGLANERYLLLDAPGLGKTLQMIYVAEERHKREGLEHCLIVCGINTLKANWRKEIGIHSDLSCKILGEKVNKKGKLTYGGVQERINDLKNPIDEFFVITNIETLRNDEIVKLINDGKVNKFDMIILDECHRAKNPQSQQGKNFLKLTKAKYRIGLTGTLLLNSPLDSFVPLKWLGVDHSTYTNFKYFYCSFSGPFNNILMGYKNIPVLKQELESCSLRRTKDILDLPPKNIINETVEMDDAQALLYKNIKEGIVDQIDKVELTTTNLLAMTARLRQATACPTMLTTEEISSAKIDRCCDLVEQIVGNGEKVVIFSVFKETLNVLMNKLAEYNPVLCTGDVKDSIVSENIDKFQNDDRYKVFLGTTAKTGTGITLTAASYCIFIDCPWTAADFEQASDRIYRIGTNKSVFIYKLITADTIDEHVDEILEAKGNISDYVIDNKVSAHTIDSLRKYILDLKT